MFSVSFEWLICSARSFSQADAKRGLSRSLGQAAGRRRFSDVITGKVRPTSDSDYRGLIVLVGMSGRNLRNGLARNSKHQGFLAI